MLKLAATPYAQRALGAGPDTPVPVFQHEWEFERLLELYRERAPQRVLEIGTYHGGTLYHWLQNAASGAVVVSIDSYAVGVDNRKLYLDWVPDGVMLHVLVGDSSSGKTFAEVQELAPFDWVFIDAGHRYHEVKIDWSLYAPMVRPGGIVALHDILPPSAAWPEIEVETLWRELQREGHLTQELVADPAADWGGIGVVYL